MSFSDYLSQTTRAYRQSITQEHMPDVLGKLGEIRLIAKRAKSRRGELWHP